MDSLSLGAWAGRAVMLAGLLVMTACTTTGGSRVGEAGGASRARSMEVLYVTDRARTTAPDGSLSYGSERSKTLSFGSAVLEEQAPSGRQDQFTVARVTEVGAFPATPYPMEAVAGGLRRTPATISAHKRAAAELQDEVARSLARSKRKEIVFFIHGYANDFDDALETTGSLCRTLHDEFVCIALTWPAGGSRGAFMGYNVDRESGEFAVADMKKAIRIIATTPGVKKVHIIAHSRGTDVLASVLQQLAIETYVGHSTLEQRYKIDNVVLFAADIDLDVARTKLFGLSSDPDLPIGSKADPAGLVRHGSFHLTVYSSPKDRALGISGRIFGSTARLGQVSLPKLGAAKPFANGDGARLSQWIDFIEFDGDAGWIGHSYFVSNPAVGADLDALIRENLMPGDPGRPLVEIKRPFWRVVDKPAPSSTAQPAVASAAAKP